MYDNMNEDDLIALLSSLQGSTNGGLPGKTSANKLNYYQDMISTLGFDPIQGLGSADPDAPETPEYVPAVNKQRYIYESDPQYKKIFDLIDAGASPATAVKESGITDDALAKEAQKVAIDYSGSVVDEMNNKSKFDQTNAKAAAKYTAPDGSKYKNAPLGGPSSDIMASAPEYDLMGAPTVDDLLQQLIDTRKAPAREAMFRDQKGSRSAAATYTTPGVKAGQSVTKQMGDVDAGAYGQMKFTPDEIAHANEMQKNSPTYTTKATKSKAATSNSGNGPERSWEAPDRTPTGKSYIGGSAMEESAYRQVAAKRIGQAKKTQVRSDANNNAMRRVLALRTILEG